MLEPQNMAFTQCGINLLFIGTDCKITSPKLKMHKRMNTTIKNIKTVILKIPQHSPSYRHY